jgi:site-specific recombinase XerD
MEETNRTPIIWNSATCRVASQIELPALHSKKGQCANGPHCEHWTLHKWKHTFATNALRSEVDVKTLQVMLGHMNLSTTEKYLKSLPAPGLRSKIEKSMMAAILKGK